MTNFTENSSLLDLIARVIDYAYAIAPLVAIIFFFWGGLQYVIAAGNKQKAKAARDTVTHAVIGLVVIYTSYLIVDQVFKVLGVDRGAISIMGFDFLKK